MKTVKEVCDALGIGSAFTRTFIEAKAIRDLCRESNVSCWITYSNTSTRYYVTELKPDFEWTDSGLEPT